MIESSCGVYQREMLLGSHPIAVPTLFDKELAWKSPSKSGYVAFPLLTSEG